MTIKFDLEKAKAGETIEYKEAYGWTEIRFIGSWDSESVVCEVMWNDKPEIVNISHLRMAKKKEIVRYRVALMKRFDDGGYYTYSVDNEVEEQSESRDESFIQWLTDWQEYEIGANDENALPKSI